MKRALVSVTVAVLVAAFLAAGYSCLKMAEAAGTEPPGAAAPLRDAIFQPSTYVDARVLAANTAETITAPTFAAYPSAKLLATFSGTCSNWYYSATGTAAVPAGDVTDGSAAERAPTALKLTQASTLSIVADATCTVTVGYRIAREP